MKQIQTINLSAMQNEEAFGFFTLVKDVAPLKDVKAAYIEKLDAYDEALEVSNKLDSVQTVETADAATDEAWGASYAYSKAMARHPNSMIRNAALPVARIHCRDYGFIDGCHEQPYRRAEPRTGGPCEGNPPGNRGCLSGFGGQSECGGCL